MDIQLATTNDLSQLNHLLYRSKASWGYDNAFMEEFMKRFQLNEPYLDHQSTFSAYLKNKLIGFYSFSTPRTDHLELDNFFVHPDLIGQGIGKQLWSICVETARGYGATAFTLWSDPNADGFYYKMGCEKIGQKVSFIPTRFPSIFKYTLHPTAI